MILQRFASVICSLLSVASAIIMVLMTTSFYKHQNWQSYYSWLMFIPIIFFFVMAVLCGFRCLPFPSCLGEKLCPNFDEEIPDTSASTQPSNYQQLLQEPSTSTYREDRSSTSRSFFASGDTEIALPFKVVDKNKAGTQETRQFKITPFYPAPYTYEHRQIKKTDPLPPPVEQKYNRFIIAPPRERVVSEGSVRFVEPPGKLDRAYSEGSSLLAKAKTPISLSEGTNVYGTFDEEEFQRKYPFPMYGIMPKLPGINTNDDQINKTLLQSTSLQETSFRFREHESAQDLEKSNSWPLSDPKPPVFYFTPEKRKKVEEITSPKVELELPASTSRFKVEDWLVNSPVFELPSESVHTKEKPDFTSKRSKKSTHVSKSKKTSKSRSSVQDTGTPSKKRTDNSDKVSIETPVKKESDSTSPEAQGLKKFFILGRGYFYAAESDDYVPVESPYQAENDSTALPETSANSTSEITEKECKDD